jgi:hypothetical protein
MELSEYLKFLKWIVDKAYVTYNKGIFKWYYYPTGKEYTNEELVTLFLHDRGEKKEVTTSSGGSYQKV